VVAQNIKKMALLLRAAGPLMPPALLLQLTVYAGY
jgi:hypothetical protein